VTFNFSCLVILSNVCILAFLHDFCLKWITSRTVCKEQRGESPAGNRLTVDTNQLKSFLLIKKKLIIREPNHSWRNYVSNRSFKSLPQCYDLS
jgi:hypothetical protein